MKKIWAWFEEHMSPVIVTFSIITIMVFTVVVLILNSKSLEVSDSLITCFFAFFGTEMISLASIKVTKHIKTLGINQEDNNDVEEDNE